MPTEPLVRVCRPLSGMVKKLIGRILPKTVTRSCKRCLAFIKASPSLVKRWRDVLLRPDPKCYLRTAHGTSMVQRRDKTQLPGALKSPIWTEG